MTRPTTPEQNKAEQQEADHHDNLETGKPVHSQLPLLIFIAFETYQNSVSP